MDLDEFSDDGLDDLPDNAFQELENNAISLTQARQQHHAPAPPQGNTSQPGQPQFSEYGWDDDDDDLDTSEVINNAGPPVGRPPVDNSLPKQQQQQHHQPPAAAAAAAAAAARPQRPAPNPNWNPAITPANRPNPALANRQRLPPSQQHPNQIGGGGGLSSRPQASQFAKPALPPPRLGGHGGGLSQQQQQQQQPPSNSQQYMQHPDNVITALQQRVRALENELNASRGEISIIRANSTKAEQDHSAEVHRLKRMNAEQVARQERLVEAAVAAEKTASTELQFLQQDMREATHRNKRKGDGAGGGGKNQNTMGMTTPKKSNKTWVVADGFDEMEIASPSKGQGQGRTKNAGSVASNVGERTPSKNKRKRPAVDSPVMALETHTTDDVVMLDKPNAGAAAVQTAHAAVAATAPAPLFEFLQIILDHAAYHQEPPTFELLSRFSFPSDLHTSLATHIFQTVPVMGHPQRPMQLLVDFSEHVLRLWIRCVDEVLWEPIKYLSALVTFTLQLHTTYVAPLIIGNLSSATQSTIRRLAEGRHRLPDGDLSKSEEYGFLEQHIDTTTIMSLLYASALSCVTSTTETETGPEPKIVDFWRLMSLDFVMLLLTPKQKPDDIIGMLDMLATSSLPGSLGPILEDKEPSFVSGLIVERVSAKLTENPLSSRTNAAAANATTASDKRRIRAAALRAMLAFTRHPWGTMQLAKHDNALPRVVTCLSAAIDDLYDQPVPPHVFPPLDDDDDEYVGGWEDGDMGQGGVATMAPSTALNRIITQCVTLLHTLITDPQTANVVDIAQKLSVSYGGSQRYLISLGRLTFAEEDLVMESGIESEVVEMAHELLEMAVTPDEGEIVSEAFGA